MQLQESSGLPVATGICFIRQHVSGIRMLFQGCSSVDTGRVRRVHYVQRPAGLLSVHAC